MSADNPFPAHVAIERTRGMSENEIVPVPKDELAQLRANDARYRWIIANCTYLEHRVGGKLPSDASVIGGYWPITGDELGAFDSALVGLNLNEYLKAVVQS